MAGDLIEFRVVETRDRWGGVKFEAVFTGRPVVVTK
jgi:hypothetical protein